MTDWGGVRNPQPTIGQAFAAQRKWGWDQHTWGSVKGPCMMGACGVAWFNDHTHFTVPSRMEGPGGDQIHLLARVMREMFPHRTRHKVDGFALVEFNDHPDTTREDAWAVWEKASLREQEAV